MVVLVAQYLGDEVADAAPFQRIGLLEGKVLDQDGRLSEGDATQHDRRDVMRSRLIYPAQSRKAPA